MKEKHLGTGTATGKIILMGEHAVVYGEPAIAFPFHAAAVTTTVESAENMWLDCTYFSGPLSESPKQLHNIKESIVETLAFLSKNDSLAITIASTIPPERGMGSSAAVAVSVIRSIFDYYNYVATDKELAILVNNAEKIAHGNPSGIDAAATSGQQALFFVKGQELQPFPMDLKDAWLIVADTGIKGQTREAVKDVAHLFEIDKVTISKKITTLGNLVQNSKQAILTNDVQQLGDAMDQAQQLLTELTVSHPMIQQLVNAAKANGALGAKLTGGGRGGCVIALASSQHSAEKIATAFRHTGAVNTWIQSLEAQK
ncbi:mevalonate kinase [Candidatus Enterococcus clewellii]|uniref:Mevalonate kinase n=1 Tax=Candidatus Enterococcus clewellii TaxID=1834193 RepID=A0A242K3Q4_9ENTE|nr:mevalonate kinase [Enterococcus sp. 9E7_DIV0242]OTP13627.1 mevalonate kinase [Enterococcus sp. 9E7_DIV0242]